MVRSPRAGAWNDSLPMGDPEEFQERGSNTYIVCERGSGGLQQVFTYVCSHHLTLKKCGHFDIRISALTIKKLECH